MLLLRVVVVFPQHEILISKKCKIVHNLLTESIKPIVRFPLKLMTGWFHIFMGKKIKTLTYKNCQMMILFENWLNTLRKNQSFYIVMWNKKEGAVPLNSNYDHGHTLQK